MEHNRRNLQIFSSNSLVWNLLDNLLIWSYLARVSMLSPLTGLADEERLLMSLKAFFLKRTLCHSEGGGNHGEADHSG